MPGVHKEVRIISAQNGRATEEFLKRQNEYKKWKKERAAGKTPKCPEAEDLALLGNEKTVDPY